MLMFWVMCAVVVLALGLLSVLLGNAFLPSFGQASEAGTTIPLLVAWALIATAVITALTLAKFLLSNRSR
jgi:hypothetical protein